MKFDHSKITDQKRFVRAEHWLYARTRLRARDECHSAKWRILTLAGGSPRGEMTAIRELMPKAYVVAVDTDPRCLEAAINAGADDVIECDVLAYEHERSKEQFGSSRYLVPSSLRNLAKFDAINLDLCGSVTADVKRCLGLYLRQLVTARGIVMLTFSYGRDVAEMYQVLGRQWSVQTSQTRDDDELFELPAAVPDSAAGRIMYLGNQRHLRSIMVYRGAEMPMCSALYQSGQAICQSISFTKVGPGDFEIAAVYPNSAKLYDCPQERIDSLRRKFAAIKAAFTRTARTGKSSLFHDDLAVTDHEVIPGIESVEGAS
jgi:hypothetical protein